MLVKRSINLLLIVTVGKVLIPVPLGGVEFFLFVQNPYSSYSCATWWC